MIRRYKRLLLKITLVLFCLVVVLITVRGGQAQYVCPDGSSVASGPCMLCPNGRYIGGGGVMSTRVRRCVRTSLRQRPPFRARRHLCTRRWPADPLP